MQSLPKVSPSQQRSEGSQQSSNRKAKLAHYASILTGSFRKDTSSDPGIFARSLIMVLSDYEDEVIEAVIDPRAGLPSKQSFMPTIHEVKTALEAIEAPRRRVREREKAERLQLDERKLISDQREKVGATYADMQASCHAVGLMIGVPAVSVLQGDPIRAQREMQRQHLAISDEWARDGKEPPMVGDIPISKSLCEAITKQTGVKARKA